MKGALDTAVLDSPTREVRTKVRTVCIDDLWGAVDIAPEHHQLLAHHLVILRLTGFETVARAQPVPTVGVLLRIRGPATIEVGGGAGLVACLESSEQGLENLHDPSCHEWLNHCTRSSAGLGSDKR